MIVSPIHNLFAPIIEAAEILWSLMGGPIFVMASAGMDRRVLANCSSSVARNDRRKEYLFEMRAVAIAARLRACHCLVEARRKALAIRACRSVHSHNRDWYVADSASAVSDVNRLAKRASDVHAKMMFANLLVSNWVPR